MFTAFAPQAGSPGARAPASLTAVLSACTPTLALDKLGSGGGRGPGLDSSDHNSGFNFAVDPERRPPKRTL